MSTSIFIRDPLRAILLQNLCPLSWVYGFRAFRPPSHTTSWPTLRHQSLGWLPAAAPDTLANCLDPDRLAGGLEAELTASSGVWWMVSGNRQLRSDCLWEQRPFRKCVLSPGLSRVGTLKSTWYCCLQPGGICVCFWNSHPSPYLSGCEGLVSLKRYPVSAPSVKDFRSLQFVVPFPALVTYGFSPT